MTDLQSDTGAGGKTNGAVQVEMFGTGGGAKSGTAPKVKKRTAYGGGLKAPSPIGKNFVLDTNVLLHDPDCLNRFGDNHLCIPLEVLCELDKFKNEQSERGASARTVHRKLAALFSPHPEQATTGVPNRDGGSIRLVPAQSAAASKSAVVEELLDVFRGQESNDNRILICTQMIAEKNTAPTILVTKDLNLQLKALAIGIPCEDYQNDKVDSAQVGASQMVVDLKPNDLQRFASAGSLDLPTHVRPYYWYRMYTYSYRCF